MDTISRKPCCLHPAILPWEKHWGCLRRTHRWRTGPWAEEHNLCHLGDIYVSNARIVSSSRHVYNLAKHIQLVATLAQTKGWRKEQPTNILITTVECWFPLGSATSEGTLFKDPVIKKIAEAHGKTPAQIILRWHIQDGFSIIPCASTPDYIKENIRIFDFALTDDEMRQMCSLNKEKRFFNMPLKDKERIYLNT